jgi:hypothetical protein
MAQDAHGNARMRVERSDPRTQAYLQRRLAEGKTLREIRRCVKRCLARHFYRTLRNYPGLNPQTI